MCANTESGSWASVSTAGVLETLGDVYVGFLDVLATSVAVVTISVA